MIFTSTILALEDKEIQAATVPPVTFLVTALLVVAVILLGIDLVRRIRRAQYREEIQQDLAAEIAERDARLAASGAPESGTAETGTTATGMTETVAPETLPADANVEGADGTTNRGDSTTGA